MHEAHRTVKDSDSDGDYVEFARAGADGQGEFKCAGCGYGITVYHKLPRCPMCREGLWERSQWSPFRHVTGLDVEAQLADRSSARPLPVTVPVSTVTPSRARRVQTGSHPRPSQVPGSMTG